MIDVDSFVGEVCGYHKQGAAYGYTRVFGYHPILATRADTREALHIRLRKGSANTQKGIKRFCEELIARVERAGATGPKLLRADSGFWNTKVFELLEKAGLAVLDRRPQHQEGQAPRSQAIPEDAWQTIPYPDGGEAQIAETVYGGRRLIVRRTRLLGPQAELWPDWRHFAFFTNRTDEHRDRRGRAPRPRRRRAGHRRPQRPSPGALPLRPLPRQRRLDRARLPRAQPAALDATARPPRHDRPRRPHPAPPTARRSPAG